jgi:hypothetical protein
VRRIIGRRATFFLLIALLCLALVAACPAQFRWVAWGCAGVAAFWSVLLAAEHVSARRNRAGL